MENEKFWLENPKALFSSFNVFPRSDMDNATKLNALTRLLLLIVLGMYLLGSDQWLTTLLLGLLLIFILRAGRRSENFGDISEQEAVDTGIRSFDPAYDSRPHVKNPETDACWFDQGVSLLNTAYELTPPLQFNHDDAAKRSYNNTKYELTPLSVENGFSQIWRNEPEMCGGYSMIPDPLTTFPVESEASQGQANYIVRSTVDTLPIEQAQTGLQSVRALAENAYSQSILDYRSNIMNEHLDRFRRERQHNCPDMKLSTAGAGAGGSI